VPYKAGTALAVASATMRRACASASWASTAPCARIRLCWAKPAGAAAVAAVTITDAAAAAAANQFVVFVVPWELLLLLYTLYMFFDCCSARRAREEREKERHWGGCCWAIIKGVGLESVAVSAAVSSWHCRLF
jgi:hypothetical protein